jgi:hypothetical protein
MRRPRTALAAAATTFSSDALLALLNTSTTECEPCSLTAAGAATSAPTVSGPGWEGCIGVEGTPTGDGRLIEPNALAWDALPLPFRFVASDIGAHDGAQVVGRMLTLERRPGGQLWATGDFDVTSPVGAEAARQVTEGLTTGVSMDLDDVSFEVRVAAEVLDMMNDPLMQIMMGDGNPADLPTDAEGRVTVATVAADEELRVTTSGRIRAATLVAIPAFAEAKIKMMDPSMMPPAQGKNPADAPGSAEGINPAGDPCSCDPADPAYDPDCQCGPAQAPPAKKVAPPGPDKRTPPPPKAAAATLVASGYPLAPPAEWFSRPSFSGPAPLLVGVEGRVYGHLAAWNTCHVGHAHSGCVTPPHSRAGYAYFHVGSILTAEGAEIPVGHITLSTVHAGPRLTASSAAAHYENTGAVVADIACGEDAWGIWVAGALRPTTTPEQVRELRAAPLSGDWRRVSGNLELVAALAVNMPGFPIPRPQGLVASGVVQSLVASGMIAPVRVRTPGTPGALTIDDLRYLKRLAARERAEDQQRQVAGLLPSATDLARRVRATTLAMRAHAPRPGPAPKESD